MTNSEYKPYFYVVGFLFTAIAVMIITNMNFGLTTNQSIVTGLVTATILLIIIKIKRL
tara:strand:+ start:577 stop:750 length:174 start_codon:yes stop_codon:yes gene_type:complete